MIVSSEIDQPPSKNGHGALYAGGIAAILASTCHHISFLLLKFGLSSAKILYIVTLADWARPFLILVALITLFISYKEIWHISFSYNSGRGNPVSRSMVTDKAFFLFVAMLVIVVLMLPYFAPCTA